MSVTFKPVRREKLALLLGVSGGTGSGKTFSALLLARGLSGGQPFAFIDTENGRAKHYADLFPEMRHAEIHAPFRPEAYADAIQAGASEYSVVVVDSASHEWAGDGGCLDWHDDLMGGDQKKNLSAWIQPKLAHKRMVTRLLQVNAHVILCFRAEPKVEAVPNPKTGKLEIVAKPSLVGLDGWIPISEKMLPYELTASVLLMAAAPGVPRPIKLPEQLKPFVPLDQPLSEETGRLLGEWAAGSSVGAGTPVSAGGAGSEGRPNTSGQPSTPAPAEPAANPAVESAVAAFTDLAAKVSPVAHSRALAAVQKNREAHGGWVDASWLAGQHARLEALVPPAEPGPDPAASVFEGMLPEGVRS